MSFRSHELYAYTLVLCRQDLQSVLAAMIQRSFKSIGTSISKEIKKRQGDNDAEIAKTLQTMHKMIVNKTFARWTMIPFRRRVCLLLQLSTR